MTCSAPLGRLQVPAEVSKRYNSSRRQVICDFTNRYELRYDAGQRIGQLGCKNGSGTLFHLPSSMSDLAPLQAEFPVLTSKPNSTWQEHIGCRGPEQGSVDPAILSSARSKVFRHSCYNCRRPHQLGKCVRIEHCRGVYTSLLCRLAVLELSASLPAARTITHSVQ